MSTDTQIPTILDIQEKALLLPGRPQFWTSHHMAGFYQTTPVKLMQQFRRNPRRFPDDFWFELREDEKAVLVTQSVLPNRANRGVLISFTHAGALALSGVLKTPVADAVSVQIIRAVVAMEAQALADVTHMLQKMQMELRYSRSTRGKIVDAGRNGWTFDQLKATVSYSRVKLTTMVKECVTLGLLAAPLADTPMELGPNLPDPNQMDMFRDV